MIISQRDINENVNIRQIRRRSLLSTLNCLGTEGQKRFSKLPDATYPQGATEYMKAVLKLEKEYKPVKNKRGKCYVFRKRAQLNYN